MVFAKSPLLSQFMLRCNPCSKNAITMSDCFYNSGHNKLSSMLHTAPSMCLCSNFYAAIESKRDEAKAERLKAPDGFS